MASIAFLLVAAAAAVVLPEPARTMTFGAARAGVVVGAVAYVNARDAASAIPIVPTSP